MNENIALELRDNAKHQLEKIKDIETGIEYLNKLKAIDVWVKAEKKDAELQNMVAEQKLRTQKILGKLLRKKDLHGGDRKTENFKVNNENLENIGLNKKQSSTFQQIASIPDEKFEEFIEEKKQAVNNAVAELTTTGAVKLAKSLKEKESHLNIMMDISDELKQNDELKSIAKEINMNYTKEQRKFFVTLIKI